MSPDLAKIAKKIRRGWGPVRSGGVTAETFRALLENSIDAVVLLDSDWKIIYASAATERLLGHTPAEIRNIDALSLVHPADTLKVKDLFAECLVNPGKPLRTIARARHKDGSWRVLEGVVTNFLQNPDVSCVVANYHDVTEHVRAEAALRESEEKFKRAFRSNPDAMSITTLADGKFLDVNDAFLRLSGFSREELVGHVSLETSWVEKEHRRQLLGALAEKGRVESMEVCFRKKTGEIFFVNLSAEIVEIGGAQCLLATSQDITDRRRGADELRQSEEQYRSLVELAPYGICRATRDGHLLMVNSALVKMLGYESAEEMLGLNLGTKVYKDPKERERILQPVHPGPAAPVETTWKRKDGTAISVRLAARLIYDNQSQLLQTEIFVENVTEQKELERQLQMAQKMDAIGQLAGGVAHDFNNLMMIMRSRAELIMMDASKPESVADQAEEIIRATRQAASLTRQLLAFSRHQVLEPVVLNFNVLLAELSDMLPRLIGRHLEPRIVAAPNH